MTSSISMQQIFRDVEGVDARRLRQRGIEPPVDLKLRSRLLQPVLDLLGPLRPGVLDLNLRHVVFIEMTLLADGSGRRPYALSRMLCARRLLAP
jgi:hypothetical protein